MTSIDTMAKSRPNPANTTSSASRQTSPNRGTSPNSSATYERIARRAYEIWERAGRPEGQSEQHWREAEDELRRA